MTFDTILTVFIIGSAVALWFAVGMHILAFIF